MEPNEMKTNKFKGGIMDEYYRLFSAYKNKPIKKKTLALEKYSVGGAKPYNFLAAVTPHAGIETNKTDNHQKSANLKYTIALRVIKPINLHSNKNLSDNNSG